MPDFSTRPHLSQFLGHPDQYAAALAAWRGGSATPASTPTSRAAPAATPAATAASPAGALNTFANSAGMQFQLQQGENAIQNNYAAHGALQSGAAMKALTNYAQGTALNNYFMPYTSLLAGQQNMGASAASSLAGQGQTYAANMANLGSSYGAAVNGAGANYTGTVGGLGSGLAGAVSGLGQNYGNAVTGINGAMGGAIQNGATNIGNLQLANGQNTANMWNQVGGAIGTFAGALTPTPHY